MGASGNYLIAQYYLPRNGLLTSDKDQCPIDISFLDKIKYLFDGQRHQHNRWKTIDEYIDIWRGYYVASAAYQTMTKKSENEGNEKKLSLADRFSFPKVKQKELKSFLENNILIFDDLANTPTDRILTAPIILIWKIQPDKTIKAKTRLVLRGF